MAKVKKITRMDHVAVFVSDLDKTFHFYHDLLGLEVREYVEHPKPGSTDIKGVSEMTGFPDIPHKSRQYRMTLPENPGLTIDIGEWITPKSPVGRYPLNHVPSAHFCFDVEDIEATYKFLKGEGVEFVSPPTYWGAGEGGWVVVFFYDPDGYLLELNQPQPQNIKTDPAEKAEKAALPSKKEPIN